MPTRLAIGGSAGAETQTGQFADPQGPLHLGRGQDFQAIGLDRLDQRTLDAAAAPRRNPACRFCVMLLQAASSSFPNSASSSCFTPSYSPPRSEQLVFQFGERLGAGRFGALQPGVQHQRGKILLLVDLAEDGADLADDQFEHVDLLVEDAQHRDPRWCRR